MIINNKEYGIIICKNIKDKFIGLMFKKKKIDKIYVFKNCSSIHTFFMKQNIDVCMLDKDNKVVLLKESVYKNKIIYHKNAKITLEMPLNTAKYLKLNEKIKIK